MIRVIARRKLAPGQEATAFVAAWTRFMRALSAKEGGACGGTLYRSVVNPTEFVSVTNWPSVDAWRSYWDGPLDPEGDPRVCEVLEEVAQVERGIQT
jgi:heme-degrading monooxygenase HmoA